MDGEQPKYSQNNGLNSLLEGVVGDIRDFAENQINRIQRLAEIGIALSAEKNINKLLEMIVDEAMDFTNADAGTLYILDDAENCLRFEILKNKTQKTHLGGSSGKAIDLPPVPLTIDGKKNYSNVSSYAALTGEIVNIPDVYTAKNFDFTGPKKYDQQTGYRSRSMLVIPMKNHENDIIGVLQLLNALDLKSGEPLPFAGEYVDLSAALASQAAVAMENARLIKDLKALFEAFIQSIATAIDEKSPYTAGHIARVTELTMMIAEGVNNSDDNAFKNVHFSEDELEELRIAAWLHDIGKITTPEYVIDKSHKLQTVFDRIDLIRTRFELIRETTRREFLEKKLAVFSGGGGKDSPELQKLDAGLTAKLDDINADETFLINCNTARAPLKSEDAQRLSEIAQKRFQSNGTPESYLTEDELYNLSVKFGTLNTEERAMIQNHALVSIKMLEKLPFPKKLSRVSEYAGGHHEKLDGSGYPYGLTEAQLPLQARIMAVADIFEALTARDRPYKSPMKLSRAVKILESMCSDNHIDKNVFKLFIDTKIHLQYARKQLDDSQIDLDG